MRRRQTMVEIIAMASMLLDHMGAVFWPHAVLLRVIGRLAMPLYAHAIVVGLDHTRNRRQYALRLLMIAIGTQPIYASVLPGSFNVVFTLLIGLCTLWALSAVPAMSESLGVVGPYGRHLIPPIILGTAALVTGILPMDYGLYGLGLMVMYRYVKEPTILLVGHLWLNMVATMWLRMAPIQHASILGTILLILPMRYPRLTAGRWIYRYFYPAHLVLIAVLIAVLR